MSIDRSLQKQNRHVPVLLNEVLDGLRLRSGMTVVDATLGNAGHAEKIAEAIGSAGTLIGLDADPLAIQESTAVLESAHAKVVLVQDNFTNIKTVLAERNIVHIDAMVMDLGLRRGSLEDSGRGFSFRRVDEPLDMRFNPHDESLVPAAEMVNEYSAETLADIFYYYADERLSRRYASAIVEARLTNPISTVGDLVNIIDEVTPNRAKRPGKSSSTKVFQALRMAVNRELEVLEQAIQDGVSLLRPDGRMAVISYHSIEDRLVKNLFKKLDSEKIIKRDPKKAILPTRSEVLENPLSRSAVLRLVTKL